METARFGVSDLVLEVPERLDPKRFDLDSYEPFIGLISRGRHWQEDSIRSVLRFLVGGEFPSIAHLAEYSYGRNAHLEANYGSFENLQGSLPFANRLACSVDLATGTGKSFVIYALARVLLNEGTVDRVLVLCPSTTIEAGLLEKFRALAADRELRDALPERTGTRNPDVIQATTTIEPGKICVENIHATYVGTKSAIADSLRGHGDSTLVLNDEAHHIFSPGKDRSFKRWYEFLAGEEFDFQRMVGFSGTCYVGDRYFPDVVYRYSLAQAMEERTVKRVWYVDEDITRTEREAFQKIRANHESNRRRYRPLKPITILVTKDIKNAVELARRLTQFLSRNGRRSKQDPGRKVLVVTSHRDHQKNVEELRRVDQKRNPVEWIVSVSMLTEGWDVKNVFQIVPHERRAFNSKLLIAQVLGRGLRIPEGLTGQQPDVIVFNHERWAPAIKHLVDEVMENDARISSYPIPERASFNFELHQIIFRVKERVERTPQATKPVDVLKKGKMSLSPQAQRIRRRTIYRRAGGSETREEATQMMYAMRTVHDVATRVLNRLKSIDLEAGTDYAKRVTRKRLEDFIKKSLRAVSVKRDLVSEENEQKILASFGPLTRRHSKHVRLSIEVDRIAKMSTAHLPIHGIGLGSLRKEALLVYDETALGAGREEDQRILTELDESNPYGSAVQRVNNPHIFKVPTNTILTSHGPERRFVRELLRNENAKAMDAWIKAPDSHFYEIEYSWRKGEHQKQASFNPDFFIQVKGGKDVLVVETKADNDVSDENRGKVKYAERHFKQLNKLQKERRYYFSFLSPQDYDVFFQALRDGTYSTFRSTLHTALSTS